jgi:hypothetical protein
VILVETLSDPLNHAIENREILSRVCQQLRIRGVIGALHRDNLRADMRVLVAYEREELFLGLRRSDDKDFPHAGQYFRDVVKKLDGRVFCALRADFYEYACVRVDRPFSRPTLFVRCR